MEKQTTNGPKFWKTLMVFLFIGFLVFVVVFPFCTAGIEPCHTKFLGMVFSDSFVAEMLARVNADERSAISSLLVAKGTILVAFAAYIVHLLRSILFELRKINEK